MRPVNGPHIVAAQFHRFRQQTQCPGFGHYPAAQALTVTPAGSAREPPDPAPPLVPFVLPAHAPRPLLLPQQVLRGQPPAQRKGPGRAPCTASVASSPFFSFCAERHILSYGAIIANPTPSCNGRRPVYPGSSRSFPPAAAKSSAPLPQEGAPGCRAAFTAGFTPFR